MRFYSYMIGAALAGFIAVIILSDTGTFGPREPSIVHGLISDASAFLKTQSQKKPCNIKGNIAASGERIYHVPGQDYYAETRIDTRYGERWFCSETEARQAGWRRSRV